MECLVHAIIWDIIKRPYNGGKFSKRYIDECNRLNLPLFDARIKIEANSVEEAWKIMEARYNAKLKNAQCQWPMRLN